MLDVKSTNKGFLPPRMDLTQIGLSPSLVQRLLVFNTTGKYFVYHDGTVWRKIDNTLVDFADYTHWGSSEFNEYYACYPLISHMEDFFVKMVLSPIVH